MGYNLSNDDAEYLALTVDGVLIPIYNKKIEVRMKKASEGEKAARIFNSTFGAKIQNVGGYKEFDLKFDTMSERDEALALTNAAIVHWRNKWIAENQEEYVEHGLPDYEPDPDAPDDPRDDKTKADWVTYLVIGAAAVTIILLLWEGKKK